MMRQIGFSFMLAMGLCFAWAWSAAAQVRNTPEPTYSGSTGFRVCNKSSSRIEVAKALNVKSGPDAPDDIISEGWYKLNPGACTTLYRGRLRYRYYLVYAQATNGSGKWSGNVRVCVSHKRFRIRTHRCGAGYYHKMFREVDTRNERNRWTYSFTD